MLMSWVRFLSRNISGRLTEFGIEGGYEFLMQNCVLRLLNSLDGT
jgi:hypothetical protein